MTENPLPVDLRSDTVTKPSAAMRKAMAEAEVGDDVYGEDPTVNRLERHLAEMLGAEAAVFCSSGTQSNLIGVLSHCQRGDEYVIGDSYHVLRHEAMGTAVFGSAAPFAIPVQPDGAVEAADVVAAIKADDQHFPRTRLLCLENTTDGRAVSLDRMKAPAEAARQAGLGVHLDGARIFNAATALGCDPRDIAAVADTVSVCLSKGLGAPVGSVLVGPADNVARARRLRKLAGGAMRQAGILAAAGLHALEHHVAGLADDHARAAQVARALIEHPAFDVREGTSHTNMVWLTCDPSSGAAFAKHMAGQGINVGRGGASMRLVLHRDVDDAALAAILSAIGSFPNPA
ncbi:MAG: low-specificity L-threonine aldolase [Acidimicrobiales bacterium]|nr:low-specificity L-threonine aldolase [Acidimicrobiales bacterium]